MLTRNFQATNKEIEAEELQAEAEALEDQIER